MEPLAKLFGSPGRLKIIRLFVFNQDSALTAAEVAERTKLSKSIARRELNELLSAEFLRKKGAQTPTRYQVNTHLDHFPALDHFIRETTSVRPQDVVSKLRKAGSLRLVTLSGLFTGTIESKIDLLVVGDSLEERPLTQAVRALEAELGRELRYAFFTTPDFRYRLGVYDRLLRDVFDYPHRVLLDKIGL